MEKAQVRITIDSDTETRKGVHADNFSITTRGDSVRIDFFLSDIQGENGENRGVLASRVFMDVSDLPELRDTLNDVIKNALSGRGGAQDGRE